MSDQALIDLLTDATVRIDIRGEISGTGFFVTRGRVLTCTHVVEAVGLTSTEWADVTITDSSGSLHLPTADSALDRDSDLAALRLPHARTTITPVLVDEAVEVDDQLYAYGFPKSAPRGTPATFVVEGVHSGPPVLIKFKHGQVLPGMSGSPLLNRRTGAVCGILRRTRDEDSDLGGYGIPLSLLPQVSGLDGLPLRNGQLHAINSGWRQAMSPEQQRQVGTRTRPVDDNGYDLVIKVSKRDADWVVSAAMPSTGEQLPSAPVDFNAVRTEVARLFRLWKAHNRLGDAEQAKLLGGVMAKALLPGIIGERLESYVADNTDVDVALHFADDIEPDLVLLPWEQLYVSERPGQRPATPLGKARRLTLTRVMSVEASSPAPPVQESLQVLLVQAPDAAGVRMADRANDLRQLAEATSDVSLIDGRQPTDDGLSKLLEEESPDVLHYIGYGLYADSADQIALGDEDRRGAVYLDDEELADVLEANPPRVVVLQPCEPPADTVPADLSVFAPRLLLVRGVDAVIAFQLPLVDADEPRRFLERFYTVLSEGGSLRSAVQEGRTRVRLRRPWAMPALFMRQPSDLRLVSARRSLASGPRGTWGPSGV